MNKKKQKKNQQIADLSRKLDSSLEKQYSELINLFKQQQTNQTNKINQMLPKVTSQESNIIFFNEIGHELKNQIQPKVISQQSDLTSVVNEPNQKQNNNIN